jgi:hypothetical protein
MKNLLVFAHAGEASCFIDNRVKIIDSPINGFYEGPEYFLLLCGEGVFNSQLKTSAALGLKSAEINTVINLGVAGKLPHNKIIEDVFSIRTCYLSIEGKPKFHSFTSSDQTASADLVSSDRRILEDKDALPLLTMGDYVDQECWGIFSAALLFKKSIYAFKTVSDTAGAQTDCEKIKSDSFHYSLKLKKFYDNLNNTHTEKDKIHNFSLPTIFYATAYQKRSWEKIIKRFDTQTREKLHSPENLQALGLETLRPKDRMIQFLSYLYDQAYPEKKKINENIKKTLVPLEAKYVKLKYDNTFESSALNLSVTLTTEEDVKDFVNNLKNFNFTRYQKSFERFEDLDV